MRPVIPDRALSQAQTTLRGNLDRRRWGNTASGLVLAAIRSAGVFEIVGHAFLLDEVRSCGKSTDLERFVVIATLQLPQNTDWMVKNIYLLLEQL